MAVVNVVVLHGMGLRMPDDAPYAKELIDNICTHFDVHGDSKDETILRFWPVNYSAIGNDEQIDLLNRHHVLPAFSVPSIGGRWMLRHWAGEKLDRWIGRYNAWRTERKARVERTPLHKPFGLSNELRSFLVTHIGDVLVYQTDAGREAMQQTLIATLKEVRRAALTGDRDLEQHYVSIIAYSLGSIITYDVCRRLGEREPDTIKGLALANLFTLGSPLALFSLQSYGGDQTHYRDRGVYLNRPDGAWLNFYDQQDVLAFPLRQVYPRKRADGGRAQPYADVSQSFATRDYDIQDIRVQTGTLRAHTGYFANTAIARQIAQKLRADYEGDRSRRGQARTGV